MTTRNESETPETDAAVKRIISFPALATFARSLETRLRATLAERDHWRANHDDAVKRCALLRERHDLPVDRIAAYKELVRLQEEVRTMKNGGQQSKSEVVIGVDSSPNGDKRVYAIVRNNEDGTSTVLSIGDAPPTHPGDATAMVAPRMREGDV